MGKNLDHEQLLKASKTLRKHHSIETLSSSFFNGPNSKLESLEQVNVLLELEEYVSAQHGVDLDLFEHIGLGDETGMNIAVLVDFINERLQGL